MNQARPNRLIFIGAVIVATSVILMDGRVNTGIVENVLLGREILDSGIEARWPVLLGVGLMLWGGYRRFGSNPDSTYPGPHSSL